MILEGLDFDDVLIEPVVSTTDLSSRSEVNLEVTYSYDSYKGTDDLQATMVPIVASNMDSVGTFNVADVFQEYKMLTFLNKYYEVKDFKENINKYNPEYTGISVGASEKDIQRAKQILEYNPEIKFVCFDVANGYTTLAAKYAEEICEIFGDQIIVAGNVVTEEGCRNLLPAHVLKVGIGSGSVCTTRIKTGIGVPQFTAIQNCKDGDWEIMSDGGCKTPGDIVKAFAAGSNYVMLGGMLAGHTQTSSEFYGMSSQYALDKYHSKSDYRTAEGKKVSLPDRGNLHYTIKDILGGLRSACTYLGHSSLQDLIHSGDREEINFYVATNQANEVFNDL